MDRDAKRRMAAFRAAFVISGYDQPIEDPKTSGRTGHGNRSSTRGTTPCSPG
jgi:hypothetical protein